MRIISKKPLRDFWKAHPDSEAPLKAWHAEVLRASWATPAELKAQYGSASILGDRRAVFNICGNQYRLVVAINYAYQVVYIRFVGTHTEYDAVNAETI